MKNTISNSDSTGLSGFFDELWRSFTVGDAPKIHLNHLVEDLQPSRGLKHRLTRRANLILNDHAGKNHKFGKSGQPPQRMDWDEYRKAPYSKCFLLYKSKNEAHISEMELYYIKRYKHLRNNDNVSEGNHRMRSHDGHYYLYLVI